MTNHGGSGYSGKEGGGAYGLDLSFFCLLGHKASFFKRREFLHSSDHSSFLGIILISRIFSSIFFLGATFEHRFFFLLRVFTRTRDDTNHFANKPKRFFPPKRKINRHFTGWIGPSIGGQSSDDHNFSIACVHTKRHRKRKKHAYIFVYIADFFI